MRKLKVESYKNNNFQFSTFNFQLFYYVFLSLFIKNKPLNYKVKRFLSLFFDSELFAKMNCF